MARSGDVEVRAPVMAGVGLTAMPGGNLLNGRFKSEDPTGMTIRFSVPAGMSLDFGDGSPAVATDGSGYVDHTHVGSGNRSWVFTASLIDPADNRWRGWRRFEVPRGPYAPFELAAVSF
jgi:hypothetical protein